MGCSFSNTDVKTKGNQIANGQTNGHEKNGLIKNVSVQNGHANGSAGQTESTSPPPEKKMRAMRGDLEQRKDAKKDREKKLQERRKKTVMKAMVMSDQIMDERERLSLASSRATSRAGTPATDRRSRTVAHPFDSNSVPPSEADEDMHNDLKRTIIGPNDQIRKDSGDTVSSVTHRKQDNDIGQTEASCSVDQCNGWSVTADDSKGTSNNNNKKTGDEENCAQDTSDVEEHGHNLSGVKLETGDNSENIT